MLINFRLRTLGDIAPWRPVPAPTDRTPDWLRRPHLDWFGLTDGWYWIETGQAELFHYSQTLVDKWMREYSGASWLGALPYVDYQVARLWEDVLDILTEALDPVPPRLAGALGPDAPWTAWERQAKAAVEQALPSHEAWDLLEAAAGWWCKRRLDTAYLQAGPLIWFWSDGVDMHIEWDNRACILDSLPAWEAMLGQYALPVAAFLQEIRTFNALFLQRMRDRIAIVQGEWARPDIALPPDLHDTQLARSRWLQQRLDGAAQREPTEWDAVFRAIAHIETLPAFATGVATRLP